MRMLLASSIVLFSTHVFAGSEKCEIPYNISTDAWQTGIHIKWSPIAINEELQIRFLDDNGLYAEVTLEADGHSEWTGMVQNLLAIPGSSFDPEDFRSPSLLRIRSDREAFSVTQFIISTEKSGFSHFTFFSRGCGCE
jgi:hypothetical protein